MEFSTKAGGFEKQRTGCVVVGVFEGRKLTAAAQALDAASGKAISAVLKSGDLEGALGKTLMLHHVPKLGAERVLLVGLGREKELTEAGYRTALAACAPAGTRHC